MKKLFTIVGLSLVLLSCKDPELEKQEALLKESQCKVDVMMRIKDYGDNTMALALTIGMKKELDQFMAVQSDSTVSCDSLEAAWTKFQDEVTKKSNEK